MIHFDYGDADYQLSAHLWERVAERIHIPIAANQLLTLIKKGKVISETPTHRYVQAKVQNSFVYFPCVKHQDYRGRTYYVVKTVLTTDMLPFASSNPR